MCMVMLIKVNCDIKSIYSNKGHLKWKTVSWYLNMVNVFFTMEFKEIEGVIFNAV